VFDCLGIPVPDPENLPAENGEWALVLGGGSSVGKAAIQMLKSCGYKVISTGSPRSADMMKKIGVDEVVDYKQEEDAIIAEIVKKTDGKLHKIFDAVAQKYDFPGKLFAAIEGGNKLFTSTNDWYVLLMSLKTEMLTQEGIRSPLTMALHSSLSN